MELMYDIRSPDLPEFLRQCVVLTIDRRLPLSPFDEHIEDLILCLVWTVHLDAENLGRGKAQKSSQHLPVTTKSLSHLAQCSVTQS